MKSGRRVARLVGAAGLTLGALSAAGIAGSSLLFTATPAGAVGCTSVPAIGLSAAIVATNGQTIATQTVNATGCDIGIYVGPAVNGVTIGGATTADAVTVTGANDTGIFAEDNSGLTVQNDTITGNGVQPASGITSYGGIVLAGDSGPTVTANSVTANGGGGIFVNDNGPVNPGSPIAGTGPLTNATNNTVSNNTISANFGNCAVVYSTHNSGGQITGGAISGNTITGEVGVFHATGPDVGGIVVATASAGATLSGVSVTGNTVSNSFEGGIIVHSHAPHDLVTGVTITGNTVGPANNWGQTNGPPTTAGIIVGVDQLPPALAPTIAATTVAQNTISGQFYGLWMSGVSGITTTPANTITVLSGGTPIYTTPAPGTGYWQAASDGGVFNYRERGLLRLGRESQAQPADRRHGDNAGPGRLLAGGFRRRCLHLRRRHLLRFYRQHQAEQAGGRHGLDSLRRRCRGRAGEPGRSWLLAGGV